MNNDLNSQDNPMQGNVYSPNIQQKSDSGQVNIQNPVGVNFKKHGNSKKRAKILVGFIFVLLIVPIIYFLISVFLNKGMSEKLTLSYWGLWEDERVMQTVIADYEKSHPNVKINYIKQDVKEYRERLSTRIENGNGPDIFTFHNTWYPMLNSYLVPIPKEIISNDEFANSFYPVTQKDLIKNGAIYGIPTGIDTLALYVNTTITNASGVAIPKNWNDFINASRTLTVKDENGKIKTSGAALGTFNNINHAPDILSLLFLQNGADLDNFESSRDSIVGVFNFYSSFATDVDNVWDDTLDTSLLSFSKGNLAFYFGYSWDYFNIKAFNPNLTFEIHPVPQLSEQPVNIASYWSVGVSAKTQNQNQALEFIKYLSEKNTQEKIFLEESKVRSFGKPYARVDLENLLVDNPFVYTFVQQGNTAGSSYFASDTYDNGLNDQMNTYLGNAVNFVYGGGSSESAFDTLLEGVNQVLLQYGQ